MEDAGQPPVIAVLCRTAGDRPPHLEGLERRAELRFTDTDGLAEAVNGADALLIWDFFSTALREVWDSADALRWVHVAAAGVDTLLFDALVESDVVVTNARGVFDRPIAEFVLACVLAHAKGLHAVHDRQLERRWDHQETEGVAGRSALVVGTGAIGREIARLLAAVDMRVRGAARSARTDDADFEAVVSSADLADHVGWADYILVAAPLTDRTRGLVGAEVLAAMKPSAYLINVGRGPIVDEPALLDAVVTGRIGGAALDVFETEPLPPDNPLWSAPGVVVSPHMSGDATGWLDTLAAQFAANAERFLDGDDLFNVVDKRLGFAVAR